MLPFEKLQEKEGIQGFKKIKLAKISLKKEYQSKILEELVEEIQEQRRQEE